ncbi:TonB-dependent receptor [Solimonas marina]|uniref:TonB-dependent receptor n=1 Tax=Solimonas marina TaxID=2714601 RepID=A0A969WFS8_9GAMM|nr:TonB-dependent receptor [Solimonas marina]NKF23925.1 TonB-dependent receptor [Solimonas marina]
MKKSMRSHLIKAGVMTMLLAPTFAYAHDYNYIEGGYLNWDQPGDDSGYHLKGSVDVLSPIAPFIEYNSVDNVDQLSLGGIFHAPLTPQVDVILGGSYEHFDVDHGGDASGYGLRGGLRWSVPNTRLELDPQVRYVNLDHDHHDDATSFRLDALYALTPAVSLQGAFQSGDDDRYEVGLRYSFGGQI